MQSVLTAKHAEEMKQKDEELNRLREKVNSLEVRALFSFFLFNDINKVQ